MLRVLVFTIAFFLAFLINLGVTPLLIRISHKFKWYDAIDERKIHPDRMPRIGGVGIFVGFAAAAFVYVVGCHIFDVKELNDLSKYSHLLLVIGFFIITSMGLMDDFLNLNRQDEEESAEEEFEPEEAEEPEPEPGKTVFELKEGWSLKPVYQYKVGEDDLEQMEIQHMLRVNHQK